MLGSALTAVVLAACGGGSAATTPSAVPTLASASPSASAVVKPAASASTAVVSAGAISSGSASGPAAAKPAASAKPTPAQATVKVTANATLGNILTDGDGKTLYTFDPTTTDPAKCPAACLGPWPAFQSATPPTAPSGVTGTFAVITRPDNGQKQVTYNKMPLYYFAPDVNPGDAKGQGSKGFGGNWQVIKVS